MLKKKVLKLVLYGLCVLFAVTFIWGIARRFSVMSMFRFDLKEYWVIAVFGLAFALTVGVYSLINLISSIISLLKYLRGKNEESGLNPTKTGNETVQEGCDTDVKQIAGDLQISDCEVLNADESKEDKPKKKLTYKERRTQKLLKERDKKYSAWFGYAIVMLATVFCLFYSVWAFFPNRLCFHDYRYNPNENGGEQLVQGGIQSYKFYQDYLGNPYFVYECDNKTFKVPLVSSFKGEDEYGKYIEYDFRLEKSFALVLDKIRKKYTTVTVETKLKYYVKDAHIVVDHKSLRTRPGEADKVCEYYGKIYSYKSLANYGTLV